MDNKFIAKTVTIRKDQEKWLKDSGVHINLSGLVQRAIDEEMNK